MLPVEGLQGTRYRQAIKGLTKVELPQLSRGLLRAEMLRHMSAKNQDNASKALGSVRAREISGIFLSTLRIFTHFKQTDPLDQD